MEFVISVFLGAYLLAIGILCYVRITKDFKGGNKK